MYTQCMRSKYPVILSLQRQFDMLQSKFVYENHTASNRKLTNALHMWLLPQWHLTHVICLINLAGQIQICTGKSRFCPANDRCYFDPWYYREYIIKSYLEVGPSTAGGLSKGTLLRPVWNMTLFVVLAGTTGEEERRGECVVGGVLWPPGELLREGWERRGPADTCFFIPVSFEKIL